MTGQQRRVCTLIQRGWTDKEIAKELGVSKQRIGQIIAALAKKLPGSGTPRRKIRELLVSDTTSSAA